MKLALALGVAAVGLTFAAHAQTPPAAPAPREERHIVMHHMGAMPEMANMDGDHDGWLSRAEASAAADRIFAHMDANHDGKLDRADHEAMRAEFESHMEDGGHRVVIHRGDGPGGDVVIEPGDGENRHVTVIRRGHGDGETPEVEAHTDHDGARTVERNVIIVRGGDDDHDAPGAPHPPHPSMAPHAPMFMMLFSNSEEADRNGDGALSQEEFRAQHLRFFDASDANGDGRIRMHEMHAPAPPTPPTPPTPPNRH